MNKINFKALKLYLLSSGSELAYGTALKYQKGVADRFNQFVLSHRMIS